MPDLNGMVMSSTAGAVGFVDQIISSAITMKASDILLEPGEKEVAVRYRLDGVLTKQGTITLPMYEHALLRIKVLGNMDVAENRKPAESKIRVDIEGHPYVLRVAIVSTNFGQMAALRILDEPLYGEFESLGMSTEMVAAVKRNISGRYGLFLVCGPTGSGKTTTVHTALKQLNNGEVNIMTLEDPVEYVMEGVNQIEIGSDVGLDFPTGLKTILRLDPDVVFVGEIRDAETAKIAIQASLTGHLVISTIHARNSVGALYRLMDLGADKYMINYALRAIVSQRLLRKVCEKCKEVYQPEKLEVETYTRVKGSVPSVLYHGKGCDWCANTRYNGRVGIYEQLEMNEEIRGLVLGGAGEEEFAKSLAEKGFPSLEKEGIRLVDTGTTSIREYMRTMYDAR